MKQIHTDKHE